jgi:hypothetical protein
MLVYQYGFSAFIGFTFVLASVLSVHCHAKMPF